MKNFYKKIEIPNYNVIQKEILDCINKEYLEKNITHSWIGNHWELYRKCPNFRSFIFPRLKRNIEQIKFYFTPPNNFLAPHVDGSDIKIPFGLNLPLMNTVGTYQYWYDCPPENTMKRKNIETKLYTKNYLSDVDVPINSDKMPIIEKLELTIPAFTKTDIMHSVENPTNKPRLIAVIRFGISKIDYSEPEDVFDTNNLSIDLIV